MLYRSDTQVQPHTAERRAGSGLFLQLRFYTLNRNVKG